MAAEPTAARMGDLEYQIGLTNILQNDRAVPPVDFAFAILKPLPIGPSTHYLLGILR